MITKLKAIKLDQRSWVLLLIFLLLVIFLLIVIFNRPQKRVSNITTPLPTFKSCSELSDTLQKAVKSSRSDGPEFDFGRATTGLSAPKAAVPEYSQTNVQVAGVDEADIVKTDGEYIYVISDRDVVISKAYPPDEAKLVSKITYDTSDSLTDLFIREDSVLIFGSRHNYSIQTEMGVTPPPRSLTFIEIWSVGDRENPRLIRKLEFEGTYVSSRKIDQYVYLVLNSTPDLQDDPIEGDLVPSFRDLRGESLIKENEDFKPIASCADVSYFEPVVQSTYINLIALDMDHPEKEVGREVVLGSAQNLYSSKSNIYIANTYYNWVEPVFLGSRSSFRETEESTYLYKFSLRADKVSYQGQTTVPGTILNQFSMDEYDENFRIATTKGHVARGGGSSTNNIYILDENLKQVGQIENIAPGEKIYSARFMGKRGYLVTFKKVDPFFVLDLSDPASPTILGKLKIPGYSDYLHPYDENHIIGLGKNTVEAEEGGFAWYQGIKIALFDVSDVANPQEKYKVDIGDRGTDSYALHDHKAFLFDREKNLLVIPVLLAEIDPALKANPNYQSNTYGDFVYQGAYVYSLSLTDGFKLKGRVTHYETTESFEKSGYYYYDDDLSVMRSLYIDHYLYTVSGKKILINDLNDLVPIKQITI